ncbi:MAG: ester cyclase [Spirochaetia bacterium]|nr:ester cyclase [Spirochaetia bacterium]
MSTEDNKRVVVRFNKEVIEQGNRASFEELMDMQFINRTALGPKNDRESMWSTFATILRPAFPDIKVEILDQVAEGDKVTTRKSLSGTHKGEIMGVPATGRPVKIDVIDIVRIRDGKYAEHWGVNTLAPVIESLRKA